jgi:hypothetical protein
MRVFIAHQQKHRLFGLLRFEVAICITFSGIEKEIIVECDLHRFVLVERMPTIFKNYDGEWCKRDNSIYLGKFLTDTHVETVASLARGRTFERDFHFALRPVTHYFNYCVASECHEASA